MCAKCLVGVCCGHDQVRVHAARAMVLLNLICFIQLFSHCRRHEDARMHPARQIPLPSLADVQSYLPSQNFPSDHLSVRHSCNPARSLFLTAITCAQQWPCGTGQMCTLPRNVIEACPGVVTLLSSGRCTLASPSHTSASPLHTPAFSSHISASSSHKSASSSHKSASSSHTSASTLHMSASSSRVSASVSHVSASSSHVQSQRSV